jgi:hypothetical protein
MPSTLKHRMSSVNRYDSTVMCLQVLAKEFGAVRYMRNQQQQGQPGKTAVTAAAIEPATGTLTANTMQLLRHAFILMAGDTAHTGMLAGALCQRMNFIVVIVLATMHALGVRVEQQAPWRRCKRNCRIHFAQCSGSVTRADACCVVSLLCWCCCRW